MKAVSHIAIGVRDMDRSIHFYRDLLGLKVCLDTMENVGGLKSLFTNPQKGKRRAVYLTIRGRAAFELSRAVTESG